MNRLVLTRHGRTAYNARRIVQGPVLDPPLDEVGVLQARRLGARLAGDPLASVVSSPLLRARETASPPAGAHGLEAITDARLTEIDWGEWNGRPKDRALLGELADLARRWQAGESRARPPGGESAAEALERALPALRDALSAAPEGDVLVVAHGRLNKLLLSFLVHGDLRHQEAFPASNAGVTVLVPAGDAWRVDRLDCRLHLRALSRLDGVPASMPTAAAS